MEENSIIEQNKEVESRLKRILGDTKFIIEESGSDSRTIYFGKNNLYKNPDYVMINTKKRRLSADYTDG